MTTTTISRWVAGCFIACTVALAMPVASQPAPTGVKLNAGDRATFCGDPDRETTERYSKAVLADMKARESAGGASGAAEVLVAMRAEYCHGHEVKK